jgi:hypothetical protein
MDCWCVVGALQEEDRFVEVADDIGDPSEAIQVRGEEGVKEDHLRSLVSGGPIEPES